MLQQSACPQCIPLDFPFVVCRALQPQPENPSPPSRRHRNVALKPSPPYVGDRALLRYLEIRRLNPAVCTRAKIQNQGTATTRNAALARKTSVVCRHKTVDTRNIGERTLIHSTKIGGHTPGRRCTHVLRMYKSWPPKRCHNTIATHSDGDRTLVRRCTKIWGANCKPGDRRTKMTRM